MRADAELTRRDALLAMGALVTTVIAGCAMFERQSELDASISELDSLLQTIEEDEELSRLAADLSRDARKLVEEHAAFAVEFNRIAVIRESSDDSLVSLLRDYEGRRVALRADLLRTQDALVAEWPEESRDEMLAVVNRKVSLVGAQRRQGG